MTNHTFLGLVINVLVCIWPGITTDYARNTESYISVYYIYLLFVLITKPPTLLFPLSLTNARFLSKNCFVQYC